MSIKKFTCGCELEVHRNHSGDIIGVNWDPLHVRLDCPKVWSMICQGQTGGVFQLESYLGRTFSKRVLPTSVSDWADLVALIRPGALENVSEDGKHTTDHYIDVKFGHEEVHYDHPLLEKILGPTYGQNVFQEQSIKIFRELAKLTGSQADTYVRKGIAKKIPKLITEAKKLFFEGCKHEGIEEELAEKIFGGIEAAQRYSFNKCLSPDSKVNTKDGKYLELTQLKIGDLILDHNNKWTKVLNIFHNGNKDVWLATFGRFSIKCTLDHKLLTHQGVAKLIDVLQQGLQVLTKNGYMHLDSLRYLGAQPTMDIEVDNEDHIFMGNGIATSNSHAVGYALNGYYYSAYPKAHFPRVFYATQLDFTDLTKRDDNDICIYDVIEDAYEYGIDIKPPDIRYKNYKACIDNKDVIFGLGKLKFVNEESIKQLPESKIDWKQFSLNYLNNIPIRAAESLILSGATQCFGVARKQQFYELKEIIKNLSQPQVDYILNSNYNLRNGIESIINMPTGRGQLCYNVVSQRKLKKLLYKLDNPPYSLNDSLNEIAKWEREYIGREFTTTELEAADAYAQYPSKNIRQSMTAEAKDDIFMPTLIRSIRVFQSKKTQNKFAYMKGYDLYSHHDSIFLSGDILQEYGSLLQEANKVVLLGNNDPLRQQFKVKKVFQL